MAEFGSITVELKSETDIVAARQEGREMARALGFGVADQTRLATAISELTRNVIQHAGVGTCTLTDHSDSSTAKIQVSVKDHGPGIPDLDQAMKDGFSTVRGLGAGLPGCRRLVHEFHIRSEPGDTAVTIAMKRSRSVTSAP